MGLASDRSNRDVRVSRFFAVVFFVLAPLIALCIYLSAVWEMGDLQREWAHLYWKQSVCNQAGVGSVVSVAFISDHAQIETRSCKAWALAFADAAKGDPDETQWMQDRDKELQQLLLIPIPGGAVLALVLTGILAAVRRGKE